MPWDNDVVLCLCGYLTPGCTESPLMRGAVPTLLYRWEAGDKGLPDAAVGSGRQVCSRLTRVQPGSASWWPHHFEQPLLASPLLVCLICPEHSLFIRLVFSHMSGTSNDTACPPGGDSLLQERADAPLCAAVSASPATGRRARPQGLGSLGSGLTLYLGTLVFSSSHSALSTLQDSGAGAKGGVLVMRDQVHIDVRVVTEAQSPLPPAPGQAQEE